MSALYDQDVLLWSERQAALLRRMPAGERVTDQLDWQNIAEEIDSVGRSQLSAVRSHIIRAFLHDLKAAAWPLARDAPHWRAAARGYRSDAVEAHAPSMRRHLDMAKLYRAALGRMPETNDEKPALPVRLECPITLEEFLAEEP